MKPEEMNAEELWAAWEKSNGTEEWDRLAAELRARLRGYDAAMKVDFLGDPHSRYNDHKNGWNDAISNVRDAIQSARAAKVDG